MLRKGPIPPLVHGLLEYVAGALFIVAPFLLSFDSDSATAVSIVVGVVILFIAAASALPTGLAKVISVSAHAVLDFVLVALLVASPFIFGFSDETEPTAVFIAMGVIHLLLSIATRFERGEPRGRRGRARAESSPGEA